MRWAGLLLVACTSEIEVSDPSENKVSSAEVRWVQVRPPNDLSLLEAPAKAVAPASASAEITVLSTARVEEVRVMAGDSVRAGAVVAVVVMPEVSRAAAEQQSTQTRILLVQQRIAALQTLRGQGLAQASELFEQERALAELTGVHAQAQTILRGHHVKDSELAEIVRSGRLSLRSPNTGVVVEVRAKLGEIVAPDSPPLLVIRGEAEARVVATVDRALPEGGRYEFWSARGVRYPLEPQPLAEVLDPGSGALQVFFAFSPPARLPDGTLGRLRIQPKSGAWEVPMTALMQTDEGTKIVVATDSEPREVSVQVLASSGASALVAGDLQAADKVMLDARRRGR